MALLLGLIAVAENSPWSPPAWSAWLCRGTHRAVRRASAGGLAVLAAFAWMFLASLPINFNGPVRAGRPGRPLGLVWALDGPQGWVLVGALGAVSEDRGSRSGGWTTSSRAGAATDASRPAAPLRAW